jgi:hypothetical protein
VRAGPMMLLAIGVLGCGCAAGMVRESRCLETLTPQFLAAEADLAKLESAWRALATTAPADGLSMVSTTAEARAELQAARLRHRETLAWYDRVYQRVRARLEEQQLLSEVFWTLAPTPGVAFYPVIRWNLRSVMWDGRDPDAESDEISRFCERLLETGSRTAGR